MKNTICISTTSICIDNYKSQQGYQKFLNRLSVWEANPYGKGSYITWRAYVEDKEDDKLYIHRGISLDYLINYYSDHDVEYTTIPTPHKYININLKTEPRDDIQKETINFLLDNIDNNQMLVCLKPGTGKTYCAINYITKKKLVPIIIVDSDKLIQQWTDSFLQFTDISKEDIFCISGSPSIRKILTMKNVPYKIIIASHRTLSSYCGDDYTKLKDVFSKLGVGIKIFDEAHIEWKNIFYVDLFTDVKYTIYLTATPGRSNVEEDKVYQNMFGDMPYFGMPEEDIIKYITCVEYFWNSHPSPMQNIEFKSSRGFDNNAYNDYLLNDKSTEFCNAIKQMLLPMYKKYGKEQKIALVFNCLNMIEFMKNWLHTILPDVSIGTFCGLIDNKKEREKELDKSIILTTIKGFNKGVDVKNLAAIINTVNVSSPILLEQLIGRLRYNKDYKSFYIQFTDKGTTNYTYYSRNRNNLISDIALKRYSIEGE